VSFLLTDSTSKHTATPGYETISFVAPEQLVKHVAEDKLVLWGWEPGGQRVPVSVPHAQFVGAFKDWVSGGMPCPAR